MNNLFTPHKLEKYSFLWSELRLVIAAIALFLGGVPPAVLLLPAASIVGYLKIAWIISGVASVYLLYRYSTGGKTLFGRKDQRDFMVFLVMIVSGLNLGLTGLMGTNIGMSISSNQLVFGAVGILYLVCAVYLYRKWKAHGERLF